VDGLASLAQTTNPAGLITALFKNSRIQSVLWVLLSATLLSSCAGEPERSEPPEGYFATYIEEDGTKKFQYTVDMPEPRGGRGNSRPGNTAGHVSGSSNRGISGGVTAGSSRSSSSGSGGGYERYKQFNEQLEDQMERELKNSGFCHSGHRETERIVEPQTVFIRGECTEKASEDDRAKYPNR